MSVVNGQKKHHKSLKLYLRLRLRLQINIFPCFSDWQTDGQTGKSKVGAHRETKSQRIRQAKNGLQSRSFKNSNHGLLRTVKDCQGMSWTVKDCHGRSWTVMDFHGLSRTFMDDFHWWLSWMTFMYDFHVWLSWMTFMDDFHGWLSWTMI